MKQTLTRSSEVYVLGGVPAEEYLAKLGIPVGVIVAALEAGEIAAGNTSSFAPKTAAGQRRWMSVVERGRHGLVEHGGWTIQDRLNRPTAVSPDNRFTLAFVGGDADTGLTSGNPKAARRKGRATAEDYPDSDHRVRYQSDTLPLFSATPIEQSVSGGQDAVAVPIVGAWILLYYRDEDELRWEISLPSGFSREDEQFSGWDVRIIGPEVLVGDQLQKDVSDIGGGDVDFEIA